jgi:hypothetical protein
LRWLRLGKPDFNMGLMGPIGLIFIFRFAKNVLIEEEINYQ